MRKLIMFNMVSLDGFFAGPNGELDWHLVDDEFNQFASDQLDSVGTILFGRVTYEGMASYWPSAAAAADDPLIAAKMNALPKIVVSRTLARADWHNTRLIHDNLAAEIAALKQQPGQDLIVFGSANLCASLIDLGLIDEFRLMISPIVLRQGQPLFANLAAPLRLRPLKIRLFSSGNVLHVYQRA